MSIPASSDPRPLRLGLVGAGRWGRVYVRTLAASADVRLARLASGNPESVRLAPGDCAVSADWRDLIRAGDLDGLIVATPPASHAAIAEAAIGAGVALLIEKPLTMDAAEAEALLALARRDGALVMVDHIHLYAPAFRELLRLAAQAGPIRRVRSRAGNNGPYRSNTPVLWDWGSHDVAMLLALAGAPPTGMAVTRLERRVVEGGTGEMLRLDFTYPDFAAEVVIGTLMDKCRWFEVECANATLVYDDVGPHKLTRDGQPVPVDPALPLSMAVTEFAAAIRNGSSDHSGLELGVQVVGILAALAGRLD